MSLFIHAEIKIYTHISKRGPDLRCAPRTVYSTQHSATTGADILLIFSFSVSLSGTNW